MSSNAFAWHGKVVDKATGAPVEGALIGRTWCRQYATPAGVATSSCWSKDTLTDNRGEFSLYGSFYFPGPPILTGVDESTPIVYKPGYKFLVLSDKNSVVEVEKIPTYLAPRKEEVDKARNSYGYGIYRVHFLDTIIEHEEEFLEILSYSTKTMRKSVSNNPVPNRSVPARPPAQGAPGLVFDPLSHSIVDISELGKNNPSTQNNLSKEKRVDLSIKVLTDRSMAVEDRRKAAATLGDYNRDPRAVLPLMEALSDKDPTIRREVLHSLYQIHDMRAVPAFIKALSDDDLGVKLAAIFALGKMKDASAIPALIKALREKNDQMRFEIINLLKNQYHEYHVLESLDTETINRMITDLGTRNMSAASYCLVEIGTPAVEHLITALTNSDNNVRREAARALGRIHDARAIEPLIAVLNDRDDNVAGAAAEALSVLSNYHNINSVKPLISALNNDHTQLFASRILVKMGSFAFDELIEATKSSNITVCSKAVLILGSIKDPKAMDTLLTALEDKSPLVRKNAAIALSEIADDRAIKPLISAWNDNNSEVRARAAAALINFGPAATEHLLNVLKSKDSYFRWRAAWCLGKRKDRSAVESMIALLNDKRTEVQWIAIDALAEIGDKRASDNLIKLCHSDDAGIKDKASSAILELTGNNNACQENQIH